MEPGQDGLIHGVGRNRLAPDVAWGPTVRDITREQLDEMTEQRRRMTASGGSFSRTISPV